METKRKLSGIFIRYQNPETGKFESNCFEDWPEKVQDEILNGKSEEWLKGIIKQLTKVLNTIGERFNIYV